MASKGPRSKLDHDTRTRRQKALEAPKEPPRPKTHWDHVLEEMVWLSKDFESERKWKLAQAKKVSIRASKSVLDFATWGEKKVKEEEHRLKKVAINISKDVKKFWTKIEKLVLYKYQLELEERKKKALDKQLNFLLGQTERYSTMLAENLVDVHYSSRSADLVLRTEEGLKKEEQGGSTATQVEKFESDDDYSIQLEDDLEDDEHTIDEDEAQITEAERSDELAALQAEADLPLEELLKYYVQTFSDAREFESESNKDLTDTIMPKRQTKDCSIQVNGSVQDFGTSSNIASLLATKEEHYSVGNNHLPHDSRQLHHVESNGDSFLEKNLTIKKLEKEVSLGGLSPSGDNESIHDPGNETDDGDYCIIDEEEQDDETTLAEEEELTKKDAADPLSEILLLQQESEMPLEELLARYTKGSCSDNDIAASGGASSSSNEQVNSDIEQNGDQDNQGLAVAEANFKLEKPTEHTEPDFTAEEVKVSHDQEIDGRESEDIIADAAAAARSAQPTGNTFSTTKVRTKFPFLIKHPLREYQHIGLDWLVTMYEKRLNGILADEMGLGKTIMTIALLAHLACEKGIWGPHLIVVPTSVMLNWETEFLKWCPAFKILTYFGTAKERKHKRQGWLKPNYFHVCITTYRLVIQDSKVFKRKKWKYLILDEAHLIKNWKSQRWQTLLNFNSKRRILLTGTPLQNDLMELWSLMHFLMPHIFQSHQEFKDWFCNPISGMVEGQEKVNKEVVDRLHNVLRPFILRRLKRDVEKQLPQKHEHVIYCRLSKRQRNLYEDFIASSETQATLASANFFGMISVIMQLRKVCNHPDLFEGRPIVSSFDMTGIDMQLSSMVCSILSSDPFSKVDLSGLNFLFTQNEYEMTSWEFEEVVAISSPPKFIQETGDGTDVPPFCSNRSEQKRRTHGTNIFEEIQKSLWDERVKHLKERTSSIAWWNSLQCQKKPVYGTNLRRLVSIKHPVFHIHEQKNNPSCYMDFSSRLTDIVLSPIERFHKMLNIIESFMFAIPASRAPVPICWCSKGRSPVFVDSAYKEECTRTLSPILAPIRPAIVRRQVYFPDRRLIQFDCGKLQELAILLRCLKSEGHRALIFTQMTKMLDILEAFINLYGYTYLRLDGSTQPEERQTLMQRFNTNPKYFLFILSTRSGGVGINLVGADTVIFYDSDWNPAMDQQAQDRCHRIGQTREVHIYRLISESTIEENILKKANQKRALDDLVIQSGSYNTEFFKKLDPMELFSGHETLKIDNIQKKNSNAAECSTDGMPTLMTNVDVEAAIKHAEDEVDYMALKRVEQEEAVDNQEFAEDGICRPEDDDLGNEDDMKHDERIAEDQRFQLAIQTKEIVGTLGETNVIEENALTIVGGDEDIDMLADVKQMAAAAAAAGQASSSFENQLRPIDRYAMRFLELWDPIVDKSAIEHQVNVEEQEWELDRIEKFKEDLEAEIDEDQEPFLYERWDADFATTAYQQHVEALAQRQLLEELECEDLDANEADENGTSKKPATTERKPKKKKKSKKTKFKSLKRGPPASDAQAGETRDDPMFVDDDVLTPEDISHESPPISPPTQKKRKKGMNAMEEEEANSRKSLKKMKKASESKNIEGSKLSLKQQSETGEMVIEEGANDLELKLPHKTKVGAKVSITYVPMKRIMLVKPEKLRKKGPPWSKDWLPPPDSWSSQEDAILCAVVQEYGTHWSFVSDVLYSMACGGLYRGRFRHPIHCSERFRELFSKYVLSAMDSSHSEKMNPGSGKALLKVTEDQVRAMLNVTSELPNNELLLQKHFVAVLSSVWRAKCQLERCQTFPSSHSSIYSSRMITSDSSAKKSQLLTEGMNSSNFRNCSRLVQSAIDDDFREQQERPVQPFSGLEPQASVDQLDLILEFAMEQEDSGTSFPYSFCVSIRCPEPLQQFTESPVEHLRPKTTRRIAENRFRMASEACIESEGSGWAQSAFFSGANNRHKSGSKSQTLGKHKSASDSSRPSKSKVQRTTESQEDSFSFSKSAIQSQRPTTFEFSVPAEVLDLDYDHTFVSYSQDSQDMESIPHNYDPNFCTELEDIGSLMDFTDIG